MAYIGSYGNLMRLYPVSTESISVGEASSYKTTMGGRVVEQRGPRPRREWAVGYQSVFTPDMNVLNGLYYGSFGQPPWVWVSPDAFAMNLFSPGASLLESGLISAGMPRTGSAVTGSGFVIPMTAMVPAGTTMTFGASEPLPAIPGERMIAGVYALGAGGTVRLVFRDAAGAWLGNVTTSTPAQWTRMTLARNVPANAHDAVLQVSAGASPVRVGAPSASYSPTLMPWIVGRGCPKASISGLSESVLKAIPGRIDHNRSEFSFTVKEVG